MDWDWDAMVQQVIEDGRMPPGTMLMLVPKYRINELGGREFDEEATLKASLLITNVGKPEGEP